ncbi:unnamed protein product [Pedinophyceae sp. YPF-701]|nr:unnamed protein product [Pedinophyceae sp. YPF-701]
MPVAGATRRGKGGGASRARQAVQAPHAAQGVDLGRATLRSDATDCSEDAGWLRVPGTPNVLFGPECSSPSHGSGHPAPLEAECAACPAEDRDDFRQDRPSSAVGLGGDQGQPTSDPALPALDTCDHPAGEATAGGGPGGVSGPPATKQPLPKPAPAPSPAKRSAPNPPQRSTAHTTAWRLRRQVAEVFAAYEACEAQVAGLLDDYNARLSQAQSCAVLLPLDDAEKAKLEASHERRMADITAKQGLSVVRSLMAHKWAWPFNQPVDLERFPSYSITIKSPMDLGTIKGRFEKDGGGYKHPDELHADVQLVFRNAKIFNPPGTDVHIMACTLEERFSEKWKEHVLPRVDEAHTQRLQDEALWMHRKAEAQRRALLAGAQHAVTAAIANLEELERLAGDARMASARAAAAARRGAGSAPADAAAGPGRGVRARADRAALDARGRAGGAAGALAAEGPLRRRARAEGGGCCGAASAVESGEGSGGGGGAGDREGVGGFGGAAAGGRAADVAAGAAAGVAAGRGAGAARRVDGRVRAADAAGAEARGDAGADAGAAEGAHGHARPAGAGDPAGEAATADADGGGRGGGVGAAERVDGGHVGRRARQRRAEALRAPGRGRRRRREPPEGPQAWLTSGGGGFRAPRPGRALAGGGRRRSACGRGKKGA